MKREGENEKKRKNGEREKPDKSNVKQNWRKGERDFENKDKGKVKEGEIKEEPRGEKKHTKLGDIIGNGCIAKDVKNMKRENK